MTVEVLGSKFEIDQARAELHRRGLSCTSRWWRRIICKLGLVKEINVGDYIKSWDVLKTAHFIETNIPTDAPILDIGGYASEILCVLHRLHYSNLTGVDLNPKIKKMPYADAIHYETADFMTTPFDSASFDVITAISVIEHGLDSQSLLAEVSRLLRPGGYFVASFDYWPDKIDTSGISIFGLDWRIFSRTEVMSFIDEASKYNLMPCGALNLDTQEQTVKTIGRNYTFAWMALQKTRA